MKIDIFPHIMTPKYREKLLKIEPNFPKQKGVFNSLYVPMLHDVELRFQVLDKYEVMQVINVSTPPLEDIVEPQKAAELARLANDEMAELVARYPKRFVGAVACLPMNDIDAALREIDRAINELGFRGVQLYTPTNNKPLGLPEFMPIYEKMAHYDLPIWLHPQRSKDFADYKTLEQSMYSINTLFARPYETAVAMTHLIFSGVFNKWPNIKFVTHHAGGIAPAFAQRARSFYDKVQTTFGPALGLKYMEGLTKPVLDYYGMFYADTQLDGYTRGLMCAYDLFGADHLVYGTDMPLGDSELGFKNTGVIIDSVERMDISDSAKKKIFADNARRILRLKV